MALPRSYQRDCWLGALSAALMLIGDLCLSVIPASPGNSGLFLRQSYLNGSYPAWRLPLLLATGLALAFSACAPAICKLSRNTARRG